jgi:hypothetical protein
MWIDHSLFLSSETKATCRLSRIALYFPFLQIHPGKVGKRWRNKSDCAKDRGENDGRGNNPPGASLLPGEQRSRKTFIPLVSSPREISMVAPLNFASMEQIPVDATQRLPAIAKTGITPGR